jgi:hypothetical protein
MKQHTEVLMIEAINFDLITEESLDNASMEFENANQAT